MFQRCLACDMLTCPGRRPETTQTDQIPMLHRGRPAALSCSHRLGGAPSRPRLHGAPPQAPAGTHHAHRPCKARAVTRDAILQRARQWTLTPHDPRALCCSAQMLHTPAHTEGQSAQPPAHAWPAPPRRHSVGPSAFIATVASASRSCAWAVTLRLKRTVSRSPCECRASAGHADVCLQGEGAG